MLKYNSFQIKQAESLIDRGFDGSNANEDALQKAQQLLNRAALDWRTFANKNPDSQVAIILLKQAEGFQNFANKAKNLIEWRE